MAGKRENICRARPIIKRKGLPPTPPAGQVPENIRCRYLSGTEKRGGFIEIHL